LETVAMIFNPRIHTSKMSHPKSADHKRYFVYKEGKCYLEGACLDTMHTFVSQRRESLGIDKKVVVLRTNLFTTLRDAGYIVESVTASYDALVKEFLEDKEKCRQKYKDDLYSWLGILDMSKETFEKFYDLAKLLGDIETFEFGYEESRYDEKHKAFEEDLKELVGVGLSLVKDLRQR